MVRTLDTSECVAIVKALEERLANLNLRRNPCMNCEKIVCSMIGIDNCCANFINWVKERNTVKTLYKQIDDPKYELSIKEKSEEEQT